MTTHKWDARDATAPSRLIDVGATAGIAGPIIFTMTVVLQNIFRSDVGWLAEPINALAIGELGWIQNANFVILTASMWLLALALHRAIAPGRLGWLGPALIAVAGSATFIALAFPLERDAAGEIFAPGIHFASGGVFFFGTAIGLIALSFRLRRDPQWRGLWGYCLGVGLAIPLAMPVLALASQQGGGPMSDYGGLVQRILLAVVVFPCLVALVARAKQVRPTRSSQ